MIVVESNVLAYPYLPGEFTPAAETLPGAPVPWRSESRNILAGYPRRGQPAFGRAHAPQGEAEDLLRDGEQAVDSQRVPELAGDGECSACDCAFVAPATKPGTRLVPRGSQGAAFVSGYQCPAPSLNAVHKSMPAPCKNLHLRQIAPARVPMLASMLR